jgi:hypothetical protein
MRTSKEIFLLRFADILYSMEQPRFRADLSKSRQGGGHGLNQERCPWRHLDVMTKLEILCERCCLRHGLHRVGFEDLDYNLLVQLTMYMTVFMDLPCLPMDFRVTVYRE